MEAAEQYWYTWGGRRFFGTLEPRRLRILMRQALIGRVTRALPVVRDARDTARRGYTTAYV